MSTSPDFQAIPEWKQCLRLGERLLEQPTVEKQCSFIHETIRNLLGADATVWLSEPYFPLPGDNDKPILPGAPVSEVVRNTFDQQLKFFDQGDNSTYIGYNQISKPSHIAIPLVSQDNMLGVLEVKRSKGRSFDQREINFLEGFAAHTAVSMQIIRQVTLKNWRMEQLSLVRQVSEQIANVLDLKSLCDRITHLIQTTFSYYYVAIFLLDGKTRSLELKASKSAIEQELSPTPFTVNIGEGIIGYVSKKGKELISPDVTKEPLYKPYSNLPNTRSEATFPFEDRSPIKIDKKHWVYSISKVINWILFTMTILQS